ncbi:hypothetical protein HG429_000920 [Candidatus Saccharibacteria bacterium]|jgi:hypothetical protein cdivTM_09431|nr:hypothetical protein [Candidatus Saccharibacteria bacterium]
MIHKLYSAYDLPADHDVCHLFEHLVVRRFLRAAEKSGNERAFVGELHGMTSESSVFFDVAFFTRESIMLFEKVIADVKPFDLSMINESVAHIEAEMKSSVVIWDEKELRKQLARCQKDFARRRSARLGKITEPAASLPLEVDYQPEDFIDITLTVEIPDVSTQATAAFFCMYPILLDLVRSACFDRAPVYPSSHSEFTAYHDGNSVSQTYTVKKSFDWQNAGKVAQSYLRTFDPAPHASRLKDLAEAFTTDPFYNSAPIYFYQKTAKPFTKEDLAKSITVANLHVILQQVVVNVSAK